MDLDFGWNPDEWFQVPDIYLVAKPLLLDSPLLFVIVTPDLLLLPDIHLAFFFFFLGYDFSSLINTGYIKRGLNESVFYYTLRVHCEGLCY